ncbi:MAG: Ig-like domain-containing protein [Bacteroidales bacterium]|nr:Ig-like domain-containing protein [Bacteroidales bacterium]
MKNIFIAVVICLPFLVGIAGCDVYDAKEVDAIITVNHRSVNMFVGETFQLTASPDEASFSWVSEEPEVAEISANGLITAKSAGATDIIISSGGQKLNVTVTVDTKIPLADFTLNEYSLSLRRDGEMSVQVFPEPMNANDYKVIEWRSMDEDIATVDYKGLVIGRTYGTTEVECTIVGTEKTITKVISVEVSIGPRPTTAFKGPHTLSSVAPYTLKAADFDHGGRDKAWYDANTGESQAGTAGIQYRIDGGDNDTRSVAIEGAGNNIGYTASGEWLVYTVEVEDAGEYTFEAEVACNAASVVRLEIDKQSDSWNEWNTLVSMNLPANNGWSNYKWETASSTITLPAGTVRLRFYFATANCNFRAIRFTYQP